MKITSETKERSCNNSPHAESKHFDHFKIAHARYACLCFSFVGNDFVTTLKPITAVCCCCYACVFSLLRDRIRTCVIAIGGETQTRSKIEGYIT